MANKKAISAIVGEVLLIVLALVMAGLVYTWLKAYVAKPLPEEFCPDGVALIVADYKCENDFVNLTLRNQGRFIVDGMIARISNDSQEIAVYTLAETVKDVFGDYNIEITKVSFTPALNPGQEQIKSFNYSKYNQITFLEIEPTKGTDKYGNRIAES